MDYGSAVYNGVEQFNTAFRKEEVCEALNAKVFHPKCKGFINAATESCGNYFVEDGEECE